MSNYAVYRVEEPHEDDFFGEIDPQRLQLTEKHFFEEGREVAVETYEDGELLSRTVSIFNEQGWEVKTVEYMGNDKEPFRIITREFNEMGLVTRTRQNFGDDESHVDTKTYDSLGRLLRSTVKGEDGEEVTETYTYKGDCPLPATYALNWPPHEAHEIRYVNIKVNLPTGQAGGEYKVSEEHLTHKADKYLSRVTRYYWNDELPNDVFEQVFNSKGKLLEEHRETAGGNGQPAKHSWHLNSDADCEPHRYILFYDDWQGATREEHFERGIRIAINMWKYDQLGRLERKYSGLDPHDELEIYTYD